MLSAPHRLRRASDFRSAMRGASKGCRLVVVHARARSVDPATADLLVGPRVGVVCSKALGNSVARHTMARRLRHIAQDLLSDWPRDVDVVIRARPEAVVASPAELREAVEYCTRKAIAKAMRSVAPLSSLPDAPGHPQHLSSAPGRRLSQERRDV